MQWSLPLPFRPVGHGETADGIFSRWRWIRPPRSARWPLPSRRGAGGRVADAVGQGLQRLTSIRFRDWGWGRAVVGSDAVDVFDDDPGIERGVSSSSRRTGILPVRSWVRTLLPSVQGDSISKS